MENFGNIWQQGLLLLSLDLEANEVWKGDNWTSFCDVTSSWEVSRTGRIFSDCLWLWEAGRYSGIRYLLELLQAFQHWVRGCERAGERSVLIGLRYVFYIFDIEGMTKSILDVNFCMSVKLDEWHVERGCESLSPLRGELSIGATCIHWAFIREAELAEGICIRLEWSWYSYMGGKATELDFGCYPWLQRLYIAREFIWISV